MTGIPATLYRTLEEKIPTGNVLNEAETILQENISICDKYEKLPSIKNIMIPEDLFTDFGLTVNKCCNQTPSSKGMVKHAKVATFNGKGLTFFVVDAKNDIPQLLLKGITPEKLNEYNMVGNILVKSKQ